MKRLVLALILAAFVGGCQTSGTRGTDPSHGLPKLAATQMDMRDLWVDHIFWVRSVVVARANKNKNAESEAEKQVVENARKIAGSIEPFYGQEASKKLFELLSGHYGAIKDYINATFPKSRTAQQEEATSKLVSNASEIATFLSEANPNLPKDTLLNLLTAHGSHHISQINEIRNKDFAAEARTWEIMKNHIYALSDALTAGIAKQFPDKL